VTRIIEVPEDFERTELRDPSSGFVAYVPASSIKKGEALAKTGGNGKTIPCAACHGEGLKGMGDTFPQGVQLSESRPACSVASANQETLTAQSAAWSTHPVGVRCCSTVPRTSPTRFSTRSGASSSSSCVTERCTGFSLLRSPTSSIEALGASKKPVAANRG
jgi:hypothetical protein